MAILQSVWQKLARKNPESAALITPALTPFKPETAAPITDPIQDRLPDQYRPLWQLLTQRQIIEVRIPGSSLSYQTLVLAIDIQRGLLWLDDLFPSQRLLEIGDQISLRHHRQGEQLSFNSPILAWGSNYGANGFAIMLPDQLSYVPRRRSRRANMSDRPSLSLKIRTIGQEPSFGQILDISTGGLRASIPGNMLGQLRHGALLPLCELSLSPELSIRCSARVCSFRLLRSPHRHTQISIEFVNLAEDRLQLLQQFINNLIYLQPRAERSALCDA